MIRPGSLAITLHSSPFAARRAPVPLIFNGEMNLRGLHSAPRRTRPLALLALAIVWGRQFKTPDKPVAGSKTKTGYANTYGNLT